MSFIKRVLTIYKGGKSREEKLFFIFKIIIWLAPLVLFVFILNRHFVPSGKMTVTYNIVKGSQLVRNFASKESDKLISTPNIVGSKDYYQLISVSPMYFDVKVPRPFKTASVSLKYQNPNNQPVIELGVQLANKGFTSTVMAYQNNTLNSLPDYWELIKEGDIYLWQKNIEYYREKMTKIRTFDNLKKRLDQWKSDKLVKAETAEQQQTIEEKYQKELDQITQDSIVTKKGNVKFSSINDFLTNIPSQKEVLQFQYNLNKYYELPGYHKNDKVIEITKSMRGKQEIFTYLGEGEDLNFVFNIVDSNRHPGKDTVNISVVNALGEKVKEVKEADDGVTLANGKVTQERSVRLNANSLPHGLYRIIIDTNDDIFIKKIITFQHLFMFAGSIYLTDSKSYKDVIGDKQITPTILYTNSTSIQASTSHQESLQNLRIGTKEIKLTEVHAQKEIKDLKGITTIVSYKNDVYIGGDGFFAFNKDQLFDTTVLNAPSLESVVNIDNYNYIIANYPQATKEGDWLVAKASVGPGQLYFDKGNELLAHFYIGLPGLRENGRILKVKELTIQFEKDPITLFNFFLKVQNWFKREIMKK